MISHEYDAEPVEQKKGLIWTSGLISPILCVIIGLGLALFGLNQAASNNALEARLTRANITQHSLASSVSKLTNTVDILSQQQFAKCRAARNSFDQLMDTNTRQNFSIFLLVTLGTKQPKSGGINSVTQQAFGVYLHSVADYNQAVREPDLCKSF